MGRKEIAAAKRVLKSGVLTQGPEVSAFEKEFSAIVGGRNAIAVNSGTSALHLALLACEIGKGDEVIVPSFSFAASANAIALTGAEPIFADISLDNYCIDPNSIEKLITHKTKAILPVHLYGHMAPMDPILELAKKHKLLIIEDAAQAHLASYKGSNAGEFGIVSAFSFYPTKNMSVGGEGGMVVTNSEVIARRLRLLRNQGQEVRYQNEICGFNNRLSEVHAAIGRVQLKKLPERTEKRRTIASLYNSNLTNLIIPRVDSGVEHVYHQYTVRLTDNSKSRDAILMSLKKIGIQCAVYYPTPIHQLSSFRKSVTLVNSDKAALECFSIPVHPDLTKREVRFIYSSINSILDS